MAPTYEPKAKRRKVENSGTKWESAIRSARDLHDLLRFKQSSSPEVKHGIQKFKDFLTEIGKARDNSDRASKLQVLQEYCDDQSSGNKHTTCFPDLISTWSFAAQSNNDSILSAVPAVLALFLRTISTQIQFRDFGLSLCRTLLEKDQLRLFDKGLTSAKAKDFLISPCLRLLTEVVSFDGGAVAKALYLRRDTLFKRLDVHLDHGMTADRDNEDNRRKPTVRRNAQRYILANLKFQSSGAKEDLIAEGKILRRTLQGIYRDGSDIIADILRSIGKDIVEDAAMSRKSKTRFFNAANLGSIASVYRVTDSDRRVENGSLEDAMALETETVGENTDIAHTPNVRTIAHELLLRICTQQENGVLLPDLGWYPLGSNPEEAALGQEEDTIDLGLESPLYFDNYDHKIPVKNGTLSAFIQGLRPAADNLQAALLLKIFEAAPELVAEYFSKQRTFTSEPKADPEWLGEAAFLFSVTDLPIPAYCGWDAKLPTVPPPASIVVESILPRPLDRSTITRCLNINHEVITLFAVRVVTVALKKLQKICAVFGTASYEPERWKQGTEKLKKAVSQRCPQIKVVIQALQRAAKDDLNLRGALIELLATYFRVLPGVALRDKFDSSSVLMDVINRYDTKAADESEEGQLLEQMSNLVFVAQMSPLTNWWNKSGSDVSLFFRLLRIAASSAAPNVRTIQAVLRTISVEKGVLPDDHQAFDALLASLASSKEWSPSPATFAFIDNCMLRIVRQPVHYLDLSALSMVNDAESNVWGTLVSCIAEQWAFIAKSGELDAQKNVAEWIARFFAALSLDVENATLSSVRTVRDDMIKTTQGTPGSTLEKAFKKQRKHPLKLEPSEVSDEPQMNGGIKADEVKENPSQVVLEDIFGVPARSPDSLQGLDRWENADLESAVSTGRLGRLLQCIASAEEIRRQAFLILRQLMAIVKDSTYPEKRALYLLLGEVCETVHNSGLETRVASIVAEVAAQIGAIIADPSHKMYGKINKFLGKAPTWDAQKTISYWIDRILLKEPEDDEGHDLEVNWLLGLLINGLRTAEDMELYRKANVFERILSLYCSPQISTKAQHKVLEVVYRAVQVGGSMTLITRAGILSWIDIQVLSDIKYTRVLQALKSALEGSSDPMEVEAWKTRSAKQ